MMKLTKAGLGLAAAAAIATTGAGVASAWGPSRATFTMEKPASYITFNSITNNEIGDERFFVSASKWTGSAYDNNYTDSTVVEDGQQYVVRIYVHNNAASNLGLIAKNVRAYVILPTETATQITVTGKISADNANPKSVWDDTTFKSSNGKKFNLAYVDGSAKYYNYSKDGKLRTFSLDGLNDSNDLFTSKGHLLGFDKMDGNMPGCSEYSGYLTFFVKAQFEQTPNPKVEIKKEVKLLGTDTWSEKLTAKAGDTVRYRIFAKNTGNITLENFAIRDILPAGLTYIKGSTTIVNTNHPNGLTLSDNIITDKGVNIGTYTAGAGAYLYFNAKVNADLGEKCESTLLHNVAQVTASKLTRAEQDSADVIVDGRICKDNPNFKLDKMVQIKGSNEWKETVTVKAGQTVRYRIQFQNTGDTELKNVVIRDVLPNGMSYVKGSTVLNDKTVGDGIVADGINIGTVAKGTTATVYFYATVKSELKDNCYDSTLTNVAKGKYNNDSKTEKSDTAKVAVLGKVCEDKPVIPETGAASIITGVLGSASVATAAGYYVISRKKLN